MILVDSSVWIEFYNNARATPDFDRVLQLGEAATTDVIITEVLQGFRLSHDRRYRMALEDLDACHYVPMFGKSLAIRSAENYRLVRSQGVTPRGTIDVLLATLCVERELPLLTRDPRDFAPLAEILGLRLA